MYRAKTPFRVIATNVSSENAFSSYCNAHFAITRLGGFGFLRVVAAATGVAITRLGGFGFLRFVAAATGVAITRLGGFGFLRVVAAAPGVAITRLGRFGFLIFRLATGNHPFRNRRIHYLIPASTRHRNTLRSHRTVLQESYTALAV